MKPRPSARYHILTFFGPFHSLRYLAEVQSTVAESTDATGAVVVSCWAPSFIELIELVARLATSFLRCHLRNRISIFAPSLAPFVFDNKGEGCTAVVQLGIFCLDFD